MTTIYPLLRRSAVLICTGAAFAFPAIRALADDGASQADAFPTYESYIKVAGQDASITGDPAAFATRTGTPTTGSFGIEDFYYSKDLTDNITVTSNGHALSGSDDYLASAKLDAANIGSAEVGYSRFRTFYDAIGGFFPRADEFEVWDPESLHVDRSSFWVNLKSAMPDRPVFSLSFRDDIRTGMKDSTEWAPTINPDADIVKGVLVGTAPPTNLPYIAPNVMLLDEHHTSASASMVATIGKTTETLKATVDAVNNDDGRDYIKYPGSKVLADPAVTVQDDLETRRTTSFSVVNETETQFNDQLALDTGLTYSQAACADGGAWITPTYSTTAKAVYNADTAVDIFGGSRVYDYAGRIALEYTPTSDWRAGLAFRQEFDDASSAGGYVNTSLTATAKTISAANLVTKDEPTYSHYDEHIGTPEVSLQYLGIQGLDLYASFDDRVNKADQRWINPYAAVTTTGSGAPVYAGAPLADLFVQDANQDNENAKVGANWNATSAVTVRAEVYRKDDENRYIGSDAILGTASYGAFFANDYDLTGLKFSVILKPLKTLTLSTRYQSARGMMAVTGNSITGGNGDETTSGRIRTDMISETVNWTPIQQLYVQANLNVVYNCIQTAYPEVIVSATSYVPSPIQNSNDNYITGSALCGFVLDKKTDLQLVGTWTQAQDYNPQIATGGQPYGAGFFEESATAGLKHVFTNRLQGELKAGYLRRTDATTGGYTNYKGPLFYAAVTYSL